MEMFKFGIQNKRKIVTGDGGGGIGRGRGVVSEKGKGEGEKIILVKPGQRQVF